MIILGALIVKRLGTWTKDKQIKQSGDLAIKKSEATLACSRGFYGKKNGSLQNTPTPIPFMMMKINA